jgi:hypothetical protein
MSTKSALAALGLQPDSMRSVWNGMSGRDRSFMARLAMVLEEKEVTEGGEVRRVKSAQKAWDEMSRAQQISIREAARRVSSWAHSVGIIEAIREAA